jgi:hypothetical protein
MKDNKSVEKTHFDNMRDVRYCEIFLMCGNAGSNVYNTAGLNNEKNPNDTSPHSIVANFSTEAVKEQYQVQGVFLNGPRHFTMDSFDILMGTEVRDFNGLKARWVNALYLQPGVNLSANSNKTAYIPSTAKRNSTWFFDKGKPAFILDDPNGTAWVMKSYSNIVDKNLTYKNLPTLGTKLKLPPGWKYRAKALPENLTMVPVNGTARITQDELQNTYDACDKGACNYKL